MTQKKALITGVTGQDGARNIVDKSEGMVKFSLPITGLKVTKS